MVNSRLHKPLMYAARPVGAMVGFLIAACALMGMLAGCTTPGGEGENANIEQAEGGELVAGRAEVTDRVSRAVAPGQRVLVLNGFGGDVRLRGTSDSTAQLQFIKRARGADDDGAREALQTIEIRETGTDQTYTYAIEGGEEERSAVDIRGTVPSGTHLRITVGSGTIDLQGIVGPIEVDHQNGDIAITGAGANVDVTSRNSDIRASMSRVPAQANIMLRTANGDVSLGLPPEAAVQAEARTSAGDILTEGLSFASRTFEPGTAGARFTGQLGQGNATAELRTEHGDVRFMAADAMPEDLDPPGDGALPADTAATDTVDADTTTDPDSTPSPTDTQQAPPGTVPRTDTSATDPLSPATRADSVQSI